MLRTTAQTNGGKNRIVHKQKGQQRHTKNQNKTAQKDNESKEKAIVNMQNMQIIQHQKPKGKGTLSLKTK